MGGCESRVPFQFGGNAQKLFRRWTLQPPKTRDNRCMRLVRAKRVMVIICNRLQLLRVRVSVRVRVRVKLAATLSAKRFGRRPGHEHRGERLLY